MSSISPSVSLAPANAQVRVARAVVWQIGALAVVLAWAYWPTLKVFADKWINDPQYSHGLLVPIFSAYLVWRAWKNEAFTLKPMPILGCALLATTLGLRAVSGNLLFYQVDAAAILLSIASAVLTFGGLPLLKRAWPAIAFLLFMVPLPYELERNVGEPLKVAATISSTFLLQTLGLPAVRDGNIILIDELRIGVVDACSGLKMMVTFAAFSFGAVLLIQRSRFEKFMLLLGIVPVAIVANVLRITFTGVSFDLITGEETRKFLHDAYGYLMMLIGLALLALELWVLKKLVVQPEAKPSL